MSDTGGNASRITKVDMTFQEFQRKLRELLPLSQKEFRMSDRIEDIITPQERRRIWQELRVAGYDLPELNLPLSQIPQGTGIYCLLVFGAVLVLGLPLLFLVLIAKLLPFAFLKRIQALLIDWIFPGNPDNPLAIHAPVGCETVEEAVLQLTPFRVEDYKAGLWPRETLAAKVRQIVATSSGVSFQAIQSETRWGDLDPARLTAPANASK
jgi:hypothetical protein